MKKICSTLGDSGKDILDLWIRFEKESSPMAVFANQVDKYQAIEKALEYELADESVSAQDFIDYSEKVITHPILLDRLQKVKDRLNLLSAYR